MMRRLAVYVILVSGLLLVGTEAWADEDVKMTCPATARRNTSVPVTVTFRNHKTKTVQVTRAALGMHLGNVTLIGPLVFTIPTTTVPAATFVPPPPSCFGCQGSTISATATLPVNIPIPAQARPGTFISVGLGFFGFVGTSTVREALEAGGCTIEIVP